VLEVEAVLAEEGGETASDVGVAAAVAPGFADGADDAAEGLGARGEGHGLVVEVVLDGEAAAGLEEGGDAADHGRGVGDEAEDPAGVGEVEGTGAVGEEGVEGLDVAEDALDVL